MPTQEFELSDHAAHQAPADGVVTRIPAGAHLHVNGQPTAIPAPVSQGATLQAVLDPSLAATRAAAAGAVQQVMEANRRPPVYLDHTVKPSKPRTEPPPPDATVKTPRIRLGAVQEAPPQPLPSPQKVAEIADGPPLPDGALGEDDILDLSVDIGGGPSEADVAHARAQVKPA